MTSFVLLFGYILWGYTWGSGHRNPAPRSGRRISWFADWLTPPMLPAAFLTVVIWM